MRITRKQQERIIRELSDVLKDPDIVRIKQSLNCKGMNYSRTNPRLGEIFKKQKTLLFGD